MRCERPRLYPARVPPTVSACSIDASEHTLLCATRRNRRILLPESREFMQRICLICADVIPASDLHQHLTGDYHRACFASIAAANVKVERWTQDDTAQCDLCHKDLPPFAVVLRAAHLVVHVRCFFIPPAYSSKSVGACAAMLTLTQRSVALRRYSHVLRRMARRTQMRAHAVRRADRSASAAADFLGEVRQ